MSKTKLTELSNIELGNLALTDIEARAMLSERMGAKTPKERERFLREFTSYNCATPHKDHKTK